MEILRRDENLNIIINGEQDFQTNLGWQENLVQFEDEILSSIINPIENYETVRYIHSPYTCNSSPNQTDIWYYFHFIGSNGRYDKGLDYSLVGISPEENSKMLKQSTESFFRLEFYKTPNNEPPTRINRKLVFTRTLSLPLGEKYFYTTLKDYIHVPVFMGSNYKNKENMYLFWFQDESVLNGTTFTGNTFFMTAKFMNAKDGTINDFVNDRYEISHNIVEEEDMYYQVDIDKTNSNYSYQIFKFNGTKGNRVGTVCSPIHFYEKGGEVMVPTPTPTQTPTPTPTPTPTLSMTVPPTTTPPPTTLPGCGDTISGTYAPSGSTIQSRDLDLSDATNGSTIVVNYTAGDRPNRFNIYENGFLLTNSTWAGSVTDYQGPWTGNPIDIDGTGSFSFTYNSSKTYELRVDVGNAKTSNMVDTWSVILSCTTPLTFTATINKTQIGEQPPLNVVTVTVTTSRSAIGTYLWWGKHSGLATTNDFTNLNSAMLIQSATGHTFDLVASDDVSENEGNETFAVAIFTGSTSVRGGQVAQTSEFTILDDSIRAQYRYVLLEAFLDAISGCTIPYSVNNFNYYWDQEGTRQIDGPDVLRGGVYCFRPVLFTNNENDLLGKQLISDVSFNDCPNDCQG